MDRRAFFSWAALAPLAAVSTPSPKQNVVKLEIGTPDIATTVERAVRQGLAQYDRHVASRLSYRQTVA